MWRAAIARPAIPGAGVRGPPDMLGPRSLRFRGVVYSWPWNWWSAFGLPGSSAWPPGPSIAAADSAADSLEADSELDSPVADSELDSEAEPVSGAVWSPCCVVSAGTEAAGGAGGLELFAAPASAAPPNARAATAVRPASSLVSRARMSFSFRFVWSDM